MATIETPKVVWGRKAIEDWKLVQVSPFSDKVVHLETSTSAQQWALEWLKRNA